MTLKAVTLLCLMIKGRLTSITISQEQLPPAVVPAGWAEEIPAQWPVLGAASSPASRLLDAQRLKGQVLDRPHALL